MKVDCDLISLMLSGNPFHYFSRAGKEIIFEKVSFERKFGSVTSVAKWPVKFHSVRRQESLNVSWSVVGRQATKKCHFMNFASQFQ